MVDVMIGVVMAAVGIIVGMFVVVIGMIVVIMFVFEIDQCACDRYGCYGC